MLKGEIEKEGLDMMEREMEAEMKRKYDEEKE